MMEYKGYQASVVFDDSANILHGRVVNTRDVITFQGASVADLRTEFEASVDDYLDFCAEQGIEPDKPFSGRLLVRMDPDLHRRIALASAASDTSLNAWIVEGLESCLQGRSLFHAGSYQRTLEAAVYATVWKYTAPGRALVTSPEPSPVFDTDLMVRSQPRPRFAWTDPASFRIPTGGSHVT